MKKYILIFYLLFLPAANAQPNQPIILISIDGFRWDYPEKAHTPNLDFLIENGVRAESLIPSFITKTFPNHYTIVTGLYPQNHGIVANTMHDTDLQKKFKMSDREQVQNSEWWGGEPIWVTAEKQGLRTAPIFWVGSEAEIKGVLPTYWQPFDHYLPNQTRIKRTLDFFQMPDSTKPKFVTLYFSLVDGAGHKFGPNSPKTSKAIAMADSLLGQLVDGLRDMALLDNVNLIIVSDHGMAETSSKRLIYLDDYVDLSKIQLVDLDPYAGINPDELGTDEIYHKLADAHPNFKIYKKEDIPARLHYNRNKRIPALIALPDDGWKITTHRGHKMDSRQELIGGTHGYDNQLQSMGAIFIAHGPAFKRSLRVPSFSNIHLYELMAHILGVIPAPNDGSLDSIKVVLNLDPSDIPLNPPSKGGF